MSLSTLPLSYCTNVHPAMDLQQACAGLREYTAPVRQKLNASLAAGLWLPRSVLDELVTDPRALAQLESTLRDADLVCYTLNAFPFGNFHGERVKEQVYIPDWTTTERLQYTRDCAAVLEQLLLPGTEGSISTVPLGFKALATEAGFVDRCIDRLLQLVESLDQLHDDTGSVIRLAIEPEPLCVLETTTETVRFFERLFQRAEAAGRGDVARRHLGVCFDVCHQAVEFEDPGASIASMQSAGIRINKVHITCAIHLDHPLENIEARRQLASFVEPRYLHQTFARGADGSVTSVHDLSVDLCTAPASSFASAKAWRVHFHVPVNVTQVGLLGTTRTELVQALHAVHGLEYAPHLEVETYTWAVLPGVEKPPLVEGLLGELTATRTLLAEIRSSGMANAAVP